MNGYSYYMLLCFYFFLDLLFLLDARLSIRRSSGHSITNGEVWGDTICVLLQNVAFRDPLVSLPQYFPILRTK